MSAYPGLSCAGCAWTQEFETVDDMLGRQRIHCPDCGERLEVTDNV